MSLSRGALLYVAISLTCTAALATACSGAETQDVLLGASGSSSSGSNGNASSSSGASGGSSGTSSSGGGTCEREAEPNDGTAEANVLSRVRCGTLSRKDKKDFLTFRLKPTTKSMFVNFTGRVRLRVNVDGEDTTELTPDSAGGVPFVMDQDYMVEVTALTDSSSEVDWRVELVEK